MANTPICLTGSAVQITFMLRLLSEMGRAIGVIRNDNGTSIMAFVIRQPGWYYIGFSCMIDSGTCQSPNACAWNSGSCGGTPAAIIAPQIDNRHTNMLGVIRATERGKTYHSGNQPIFLARGQTISVFATATDHGASNMRIANLTMVIRRVAGGRPVKQPRPTQSGWMNQGYNQTDMFGMYSDNYGASASFGQYDASGNQAAAYAGNIGGGDYGYYDADDEDDYYADDYGGEYDDYDEYENFENYDYDGYNYNDSGYNNGDRGTQYLAESYDIF